MKKAANYLLLTLWEPRFTKFLLVGALNTVFGYLVFSLFIYAGLHHRVALLLGTVIGVLFNYHTTGRLVFSSANKSLVRFLGVYAVMYLGQVVAFAIFSAFGVSDYLSGLIILPPFAVLTYLGMRNFVFKTQ